MSKEVEVMGKDETVACDTKKLFKDPDFPPDDTSLFSDYSTPIARLQGEITWCRPEEICKFPVLFPDNVNQGQAKQGLLGDCWFLCACTILLKNKHLMNKVLLPDQPQWGDCRYQGSFRVCLWQQGHWREVTVDDRLPCIGSALCFSQCHDPTAFWVALLEKAYAKLHGSYEGLWAGQVSEALVDLTGGLAERWSLGPGGPQNEEEEEEEEEQGSGQGIERAKRRLGPTLLRDGCGLSCSTHSSPGGVRELEQYHALTVMEWLDVRTLAGEQLRLLKIRNPWGRRYWGGDWTESGAGWSSVEPACARDLQARTEEGEFWLDESEFLSQFDDVTVGYPINEQGQLKSIYTGNLLPYRNQMFGQWVKGCTAGGCRNSSSYGNNPKFWLKMRERGEVLVSLLQHKKHKRTEQYTQRPLEVSNSPKSQQYHAIALHMWKVERKHLNLSRLLNKPASASTRCHSYEREVIVHRHLEPGYHLLVPSTFLPGAEASFVIRVFSSSPIGLSSLKSPWPSLSLASAAAWESSSVQGTWAVGSSAGGSRNFPSHWENPGFPLSVCAEPAGVAGANVRITLRQLRPDTDLHPIGFHVYKGAFEPSVARDEAPVASCVPHCYTQDVSLECCLPTGAYTIMPSTYQPDCPGRFTLTVERRVHRKVLKSQERLGGAIQEASHISVMQR